MLLSVLDSVVFDYDSPTLLQAGVVTQSVVLYYGMWPCVATLYVISKDDDFSRR